MSYRYFAFVDLLGYRVLIERDLRSGSSTLREKLTASFAALTHVNDADVKLRAISDSIFITLNNDALGFQYFAEVVRDLQIAFLKNGLLVRGGISFNEHFENGNVTYSPALIDAYRLESSGAFFPRVVIHDSVIEKLKNENELQKIIEAGLLVRHSKTFQTHIINSENWRDIYSYVKKISIDDKDVISMDPRVYAKHWYLETYLQAFRPKGERFFGYLDSWDIG